VLFDEFRNKDYAKTETEWVAKESYAEFCDFFSKIDISYNRIKMIFPLKLFKNLDTILAMNNEIIDKGVKNMECLDKLIVLNISHN